MGFDSSGNFNRVIAGGWMADAAAGIKIRADRHDLQDDDLAVGLSTCITKDGRTQPTANLPMNGKRFTNVGEPVDPSDGSTKKYVDDRFGTVFSITGIDDAGRINFTGSQSPLATGKPLGIGFTQADLFFGVKPLDIESIGKLPRFVFNNQADGMGTDVASIDETGKLETKGEVMGTFLVGVRGDTGNVHLGLYGPADVERGIIYADATSAGNVFLRVAGTQTFMFTNGGNFSAPAAIFAANAYLNTDGNLSGTIWTNWGSSSAYHAINNQIEQRASAWGASHANARFHSSRMAGAIDYNHTTDDGWGPYLEYGGYVLTGVQKNGHDNYLFRHRQPQLYSNNSGWVVAFGF